MDVIPACGKQAALLSELDANLSYAKHCLNKARKQMKNKRKTRVKVS